MKYYLITSNDDGADISEYTEEKLLERINNGDEYNFTGEFPPEPDTMYWGNIELIIRGEVIIPKKKKVVERYEI